ncbi:hypothetical protein Lfu02_59920 [Longispora fulva]|uniref:Uncharacterized protein n=1 Tax=Longispora fulva TaxID=619741 RepID=A0A8J7GTM8_9ACTN|nr:hypothetical protein [Longispora fulva]MBG6137026.1 hypothetical protein [Longispora fulva]GIG61620.1 hypothetical protein Lfu02_59920 [Longispora fulva]
MGFARDHDHGVAPGPRRPADPERRSPRHPDTGGTPQTTDLGPAALQRAVGNQAVTRLLTGQLPVQRAVVRDYPDILSRLRSLWVSDGDEYRIMSYLLTDPQDQYDTVRAMMRDGVLTEFFDQLPSDARTRFGTLITTVERYRDDRLTPDEQLSFRHRMDWVRTAADADAAFAALRGMPGTERATVLAAVPAAEFEAWSRLLPARTDPVELRALQDLEIAANGTSRAAMGTQQHAFLASQAAAQGKTVEQFLRGEADARGYGGQRALWWPRLSPAAQARWRQRFTVALSRVEAALPADLRRVLAGARAGGGGIEFDPQAVEENSAYAMNTGNIRLRVGKDWLLAAEHSPASVFENIAHELGGHRDYGTELTWDIMTDATSPAERAAAAAGGRPLYTAYGYLENELYAELRELPHRTPDSQGDEPEQDVPRQLRQIQAGFAPGVAAVVVRAFRRRIAHDARITPAALALYDRHVRAVFGITF